MNYQENQEIADDLRIGIHMTATCSQRVWHKDFHTKVMLEPAETVSILMDLISDREKLDCHQLIRTVINKDDKRDTASGKTVMPHQGYKYYQPPDVTRAWYNGIPQTGLSSTVDSYKCQDKHKRETISTEHVVTLFFVAILASCHTRGSTAQLRPLVSIIHITHKRPQRFLGCIRADSPLNTIFSFFSDYFKKHTYRLKVVDRERKPKKILRWTE